MVLVEDAPRLGDVDRLLLRQRPGQLDQPVEIGADHAVFGGGLRHALVAAQLLARLASTSFGILALAIASFSSAISCALPSPSPSWRWIAAICSRSSTSRWRSSSAALVCWPISLRQPQHLDALGQKARDLVHARGEIDRLEDLLLLLRLDVHVGGREVGERARAR